MKAKAKAASLKSKKSPVIRLNKIKKTYRSSAGVETNALRGIDITINRGEFLAIMGASGSGKSSLMHIIGLLDSAFEGSYELEGKNVGDLSANTMAELRSQHIGFVFQQFNLLKRSSVLENVLLPTTYKSSALDNRRALSAIKQVGLVEYVNSYTNQLSGGQMQRVAIARSLIMEPSILLADEPTGNLDHKTAHGIMDLFNEINKQGTTVILITHEDDIAAFADRKIELYDGEVRKDQRK